MRGSTLAISAKNGSARSADKWAARRTEESKSRTVILTRRAVASRSMLASEGIALPVSIFDIYVRGTFISEASPR
jgi:hypothetical protein